ncbi:amidohydrolase family protein [Nonomuraea sp. NPDC050536]|uniref:amidohydrolase family protein n=1 Tax=Nonomuraea sp. NPDC050536 TaxID=3364366 RepID=UPI0037C5BE8D
MALHFRGAVLPDGEVRDLWLLGDRVTFERPAQESTTVVDGGYLLPGLVDVHTHPGTGEDGFTLDRFAAECGDHVAAGVTAVRFPGLGGAVPDDVRDLPELPRMVRAGRWLAWSGLSRHADFHTIVDDLPAAAVEQARAHDGWCKIMGDWDLESDPVPYATMAAVVAAVHEAGGRVAAHCQTEAGSLNAALAGVDSIEHGMAMPETAVSLLAANASAYVPTLTVFAASAERVRLRGTDRSRLWLRGYETIIERVREAHDAGVRVLAGTDSAPFGNVATEVSHLISAGLPATTAIGAASWTARAWLGLPGLEEGGLADLVAYQEDPRVNPSVLHHPHRIVLRGRLL